mmetsp:Transcript_11202/g.23125  ORF Transcript_11202/g.23125 Transcript_11202/m.23125 type:complete len:89 (+) Transcript_11202:609-875(+)
MAVWLAFQDSQQNNATAYPSGTPIVVTTMPPIQERRLGNPPIAALCRSENVPPKMLERIPDVARSDCTHAAIEELTGPSAENPISDNT